jgi:hypothetical protein
MPGAFGLLGDPNPSHFPGDLLVEANPRLDVWMLLQCSSLVEGAETRVKLAGKAYLLARQAPDILVDGARVAIVWDEPMPGVGRPWFECPVCSQRCRHVYLRDAIACRRCHRLDYAYSRHLHRSVPGVHRIMRWRRQIGIDSHPFAAIPERPKHHTRFHRIVARILLEERALLGHLQTVTHDLERRALLRGMIPK